MIVATFVQLVPGGIRSPGAVLVFGSALVALFALKSRLLILYVIGAAAFLGWWLC